MGTVVEFPSVVENQIRKLDLEQKAYLFLRGLLALEFLADPPGFVQHFEARPEDLPGATLRGFYHHCLAAGKLPQSNDPVFDRRFAEGRLFG